MTTNTCTYCQKPMKIRNGKNGPFFGCTGYPDCKNTRNLTAQELEAWTQQQKVQTEQTNLDNTGMAEYWKKKFWEEKQFWVANAPNLAPNRPRVKVEDCQCPTCGQQLPKAVL